MVLSLRNEALRAGLPSPDPSRDRPLPVLGIETIQVILCALVLLPSNIRGGSSPNHGNRAGGTRDCFHDAAVTMPMQHQFGSAACESFPQARSVQKLATARAIGNPILLNQAEKLYWPICPGQNLA